MKVKCNNIPAIVVGIITDGGGYEPVAFVDEARKVPCTCVCIHEAWVQMRNLQMQIVQGYIAADYDRSVLERAILFAIAEIPNGIKDRASWKLYPQQDAFIDNMRKAVTTGLVSTKAFADTVSDSCFEEEK